MNHDPIQFRNRLTDLIERHATIVFILVAVLYLISFNGQWRVGLDSANYRGLAESIASGRGYSFGDWAPKNVYPGLPVLLAVIQAIFGASAIAPCVFMNLLAALVMVVTYRLIRTNYPKWVAVTVTCGVATNAWFLQQSNELMTDVPFLLGVVVTLYGWERLRLSFAERHGGPWRALLLLITGLSLAAVMRPTFLILVVSLLLISVAELFRRDRQRLSLVVLATVLGMCVLFAAIDPRNRGLSIFAGGYEHEVIEMIQGVISTGSADPMDSPASLLHRAVFVLNDQLPAGFFGEQISLFGVRVAGKRYSPTSIASSILLAGSCWLLVRRGHVLWAVLAWTLIAVTMLVSAEPRYYVMALPVLLLAWLLLLVKLADAVPRRWSEVVLGAGLALVTLNNLSASVSFVKEQRSVPFLNGYRVDHATKKGEWLAALEMAALIRDKLPADARIIGASASVLSYVGKRHVYTQRELLPRRGHVQEFPQIIADKQIAYAIFPAPHYRAKEPAIARLMERGILRPVGPTIAEVNGMRLVKLRVVIPEGDWTTLPKLYGSEVKSGPASRPNRARRSATTTTQSSP